MSAQTFAAIEVAGYALAAVLLMVTVIYFFTRHVRAVHDELTGKTARDAIAELRAGVVVARSSAGASAETGRVGGSVDGAPTSGSLHVRFVDRGTTGARRATATRTASTLGVGAKARPAASPTEKPVPASVAADSEAGTTLLSDAESSEAGTTLLSSGAASAAPASEAGTTLLVAADSEAGTTLLSDASASEAGTTLLSEGDQHEVR